MYRQIKNLIPVALIGAIALASCGQITAQADAQAVNRQPGEPQSAVLSVGSIPLRVEANGAVQPEAEIKLGFQQPGTVQAILAGVSERVKHGDVIAQLDTADLDLALSQAQASLDQSRIALESSRTQVIIATANYSRTIEGPRKAEIDAAQAAFNAAVSAYNKVKAGPQYEDIAAADAALKTAEAGVRQAQYAYDEAYRRNPAGIGGTAAAVQLEQATNNFNAAKAAYDKVAKGADNAQLSAAYQQVQSARAALEAAKNPARDFDVAQALAHLEQAQLQVRAAEVQTRLAEIQVRQARRRIEQAVIKAPVDGVISWIGVEVGETVGAQPVVGLVDDSHYYIDVMVDEIDIAAVEVGQTVRISLDALPGATMSGTIHRINPTSSLLNGVASYTARVQIDGKDPRVRPGMTADVSVVVGFHNDVLLAPNWAVRVDPQTGKAHLTVKDGNAIRQVEVLTGLRDETHTEILSGAQAGQVVVAPGG